MMNRILNTMLFEAAAVMLTFPAVADYVREDELTVVVTDAEHQSDYRTIDLRTTFPVVSLEDEALKGLMYSASGWALDAAADETRTATITAQAGTLADGVFTPDGSAKLTVLPATPGGGTTDWALAEISKKIYRLTHTSRKGGTVDDAGTCYGYFDFTQCVIEKATQADVEAAVLGAITHKIAVVQDEYRPWQPIDTTAVRSGIKTGESLENEETTATTFAFKGRGVLHYEYALTGGTLAVDADGETVSFTEATDDWVSHQVSFEGFGAHEVMFVYTAVGNSEFAAIRNVRWEEDGNGEWTRKGGDETRVDLREGVRTPKNWDEVLPFTYSSTNWTGVAGATAESKARVQIVQMMGDDPAVTNWTTEVAGTSCVLHDAPGEDAVSSRKLKVGFVWKATFDILNDETSVYREESWFDLRQTAQGLCLMFIR